MQRLPEYRVDKDKDTLSTTSLGDCPELSVGSVGQFFHHCTHSLGQGGRSLYAHTLRMSTCLTVDKVLVYSS